MTALAKRMSKWFYAWQAALNMLDGARPEELAPESAEILAALLALADSTEAARDERYPASNWRPQ